MADETPAETAVTEETTEKATETTKVEEPLGDAGKKALDAERKNARAAARERDALAAELKEIKDRDKTEAEKVAERAKTAEDRAAQAESKALRLEVAFEKGLTPAQAKRLVGSTREELETDADELLETFKPADPPAEPTVPSLDLGPRSPSRTVDDSPRGLIAAGLEQSTKNR